MRILMLHNRYLQRGGVDESMELEIGVMREHGHLVRLYEADNRNVAALGKAKTAISATWSQSAFREVGRVLDEETFDIVHVQNFFPLLSPSVHWAASRRGITVVQALRNYRFVCPKTTLYRDGKPCFDCVGRTVPWPSILHACYRDSLPGSLAVASSLVSHKLIRTWDRTVDAFIALTEANRKLLISGGLPSDRTHVKHNFLPDPGVGAGGASFLFVGRLAAEKGVATLLRTWQTLDDTFELTIIGRGPLDDLVEEAAAEHGNITWLGEMPHAEAVRRMGSARAVIVPSEWLEPFGRVVIEALARGTPVVVSRIESFAELVDDEKTGLFFEPGNHEELAVRVREMSSAEPRWMREAARNAYEDRFTPQCNYERLMAIYSIAHERRAQR